VLNRALWEALVAAVERHALVSWAWVRGHSGDPENELVDSWAVQAALEVGSVTEATVGRTRGRPSEYA
jgi:ribonuclease HI